MKALFRRILILVGSTALLLAAMAWYVGAHLVRSDEPQRADVIVLLGGNSAERAPLAAQLYQEGFADRILITGTPGDSEKNASILLKLGVPLEKISYENSSTSTQTNAINSAEVLKRLEARSIILVTSWYHSARSFRTFAKYLNGETIICVPTKEPSPWTKNDYVSAKSEIIKSFGYTACYGIPLW